MRIRYLLFIMTFCLYSCKKTTSPVTNVVQIAPDTVHTLPVQNQYRKPTIDPGFYLVGHRGYSAAYPENTLASFIGAIDIGVDAIELDVCISKDNKVVVTHDPYLNSEFTNKPDGSPLLKSEESKYVIYQMLYEDIKKFDIGSRTTAYRATRKLSPQYMPLLSEVLSECENYIKAKGKPPIKYIIEIKSFRSMEGKWQPSVNKFCTLVNEVVRTVSSDKIMINSFDNFILKEWKTNREKSIFQNVPLGYYVSDSTKTAELHFKTLGFTPELFCPWFNYSFINKDVKSCHELDVKIMPWTVNPVSKMKELKSLGVDGFLTDLPNAYMLSIKNK
ncbi:glycerophosphodiester phosphodiesterase family protein [Emticicia sp. SJ17W-69]|uniref:glycerophosphodiester phosphodiesterase family protein n=1 Tax=Emticicia sp. SJ17W-69 TaxID=3421657 RepID=UPI003EB9FF81